MIAEITRKQAEKRAFSIHGRDADAARQRISCAFAVSDVGKPHAMGVGARAAREIQ